LPDLLRGALEADYQLLAKESSQAKMDFASFIMEDGFELTSFGSIEVIPEDLVIGSFSFPALTQILVSGPRSRRDLDTAEVRVGWYPGVFEVVGVTRVGELDRIRGSHSDGQSWFNRPEFIAVLLIHQDELSGVVPPTKNIQTVENLAVLSKSDRWIEASRMSRGDFLAAWANFELLNDSEKSGDLASIFTQMCREGYVHQIWTWVSSTPPSLKTQLDTRGQFGSRFEQLVERSMQPAEPLTRSHLRKWFRQDL
jgi:hypothetical protein